MGYRDVFTNGSCFGWFERGGEGAEMRGNGACEHAPYGLLRADLRVLGWGCFWCDRQGARQCPGVGPIADIPVDGRLSFRGLER